MIKTIITGLATFVLAASAQAALNAYELFNYSTLLNGTTATGTGFAGTWSCGAAGSITTGLSYTGLPVANSALSSGGSRQIVSLANPLSSGTQWISFLYKASGNMGGNIDGVFFPNGNTTCLWFGFGLGPFSGSQGQLGLGAMTTAGTTAQGASTLATIGLGTYGDTYLVVLRIDFNTSGANDTVTVYLNPVANAAAPGVAAAGTVSTYDVGTISKVGLNVQGGATITVDEIRVGDSYGDVVGYVPAPAAPTGLTAFPGVNAVGLSWDATSGATGYKVLRGTASGNYDATNTVAANTNYDNTVVGGTTYFYVVQATNASGASANSSEVSATPTIALPGVPTGLTATGSNGAVRLHWNAGSGAASYNVKRSTSSGTEVTLTNVTTTSFTDVAVINGTPYFYQVSSTNSAGESANSAEVSATPDAPPSAPTGLTATAGTNQVSLSWTGSAGAASYNIKRSTTSGSGYATIGTATAPTTAYIDSTVVKFTQYYYVVSAVSANGEGANSAPEASATPTGTYGPTAYESFNYALGSFANNTPSTANGFSGNWSIPAAATITSGLSYSNLPTSGNAYQHSATASQNTVNFASALSSGTKHISFLIKGPGTDPGGNPVGVFLKGNNATSLFVGYEGGYSPSQTLFGLGTVSSTSLGGATPLGSTTPLSNSATNFIVVKIDFNTSGANDTVSLWLNPPAGAVGAGVPANVVVSSFDVGTITAFGINIVGAFPAVIDELRVGDLYGDVSGYSSAPAAPTVPTALALSSQLGKQVSWSGYSTNNYQVQKSADNTTWTNLGSVIVGTSVSSVFDTAFLPYYRVLEITFDGAGTNVLADGSFEIPAANNCGAAGWDAGANTTYESVWATNSWAGGTVTPHEGGNLLYMEGATAAVNPAAPNTSILSEQFPVTAGLSYNVQFYAANPVKVGGANPQYRVRFYDANHGFVSEQWSSFASAGSAWTLFSQTNTAPANAAFMELFFIQAVGAGASWDWVTLIDEVTVHALSTFGPLNVLSPAVKSGAAFIATVQTNGATALLATGTVAFKTNNVGFATSDVIAGLASGTNGGLVPPYTVTAIYSGDSTYIGSTNTLTVSSAAVAVMLGDLSATYDGTAKSAMATTAPAGFTVALTYNGSASAPTDAGTYQVIGTVVDADYYGSATNNLVIAQAPAAVTLGSLSQIYDGTPKSATATTIPPGLTVAFTYDGSINAPIDIGTYQVIGTVVDSNYYGSATNNLVISSGSYFGPGPGRVTFSGGSGAVTFSGIEGLKYSIQRATDVYFTVGVTNFPTVTAPAGGEVSVSDNFSDLGAVPDAAFYRMEYIP